MCPESRPTNGRGGSSYNRGSNTLSLADDDGYDDPNILHGQEAHGSSIGIIGMGKIGREVARRARGFDMRVLYHNRNRDEQAEEELGAEYRSLDDLLRESDFVTLNCPLTDETRNLIGARELGLMRQTAILVNVARGGVIDEDALAQAIGSGAIAGAALDVFADEPLTESPLFDLSNLTSNNEFPPELEDRLLETYFGAPPDAATRRRYQAMGCASLLRETMWSMISEIHSTLDFDYVAYTEENLARFERAYAAFESGTGAGEAP